MKFTHNEIWELIKQFNPDHQDFPVVAKFLASYARELEKESALPDKSGENKI